MESISVKQRVHSVLILLVFLASVLLSGCGGNPRAVEFMARADSLMDGRPDSALTVLDSLLAEADHLSRRQEMRCRLLRMNAINKLDTVFTAAHSAQAQTLADYFDRHGTPNEQMLAHYILGRTYADQGETPRAVDCYFDAVAKADTASADCDYAALGRVYSQMASLFHQQLLLSNEVHACQQAIRCFLCAKDTFHAIYHQGMIAGNYILMNKRDSAEILLRKTIRQYRAHGYEQEALQFSTSLMYMYVDQPDRQTELKLLIEEFDSGSALFDEHHELPPSKRQFYYYKGKYYEGINRLDSAEYYYRKAYKPQMPSSSLTMIYKGLLNISGKLYPADSVIKYSALYCMVTDSSVIRHDQQQTAQLAASYKYNSIQKEAKLSAEKSYIANIRSFCLSIALLVAITAISMIVRKNRRIRKLMEIRYNNAIVERAKLREELNSLKTKNYDEMISQKEKEIERLNQTISKHEEARLQNTARNNMALFENSDIVRLFSQKRQFKRGDSPLTADDWKHLTSEFSKSMPSAFAVMTSSRLSPLQLHVCILLLLDYEEGVIAALRGTQPQTINNAKMRANRKMFMADNSITLKTNLKRLIAP